MTALQHSLIALCDDNGNRAIHPLIDTGFGQIPSQVEFGALDHTIVLAFQYGLVKPSKAGQRQNPGY